MSSDVDYATTEGDKRKALAQLDLDALHRTTGFMIRIVQLQIFQAFFETFGPRGLTAGAFSALVTIRDNPGIQQGTLAACMLIKRSNMTKLINDLERRGLVVRRASSSDKRAIDLHLTQRGKAFVTQISEAVSQHDLAATRALSNVERERLLDYLGRISADLRARREFQS